MTKIRLGTLALALVAVLSCSPHAPAQSPRVTGIAHIAFRVSSLDSERRFFHALGFEEAFVLTRDSKPAEVFVKVNDRQFIELYPRTGADEPLGWMHVCYESDDLPSLHALYSARGLQLSPVVKAGAGNLITAFHTPSGRVVEFTQYLPGSRHSNDRGRHLGAARVSTELEGILFPVGDLAASRRLYTATLGFQPWPGNPKHRMRLSSSADQWIALEPSSANARPAFFFRAPAARTARQLRRRGFHVTRRGNRVSLQDPDGNTFFFAQDR